MIDTAAKLLQGLHIKKNLDILASKMEDILRLCMKSESLKIKAFCHESVLKKLEMRLSVLGGLLESVYPGTEILKN